MIVIDGTFEGRPCLIGFFNQQMTPVDQRDAAIAKVTFLDGEDDVFVAAEALSGKLKFNPWHVPAGVPEGGQFTTPGVEAITTGDDPSARPGDDDPDGQRVYDAAQRIAKQQGFDGTILLMPEAKGLPPSTLGLYEADAGRLVLYRDNLAGLTDRQIDGVVAHQIANGLYGVATKQDGPVADAVKGWWRQNQSGLRSSVDQVSTYAGSTLKGNGHMPTRIGEVLAEVARKENAGEQVPLLWKKFGALMKR